MKQKDIALVVVIIIVSAAISIFVSKIFITAPKNRQQKVEVVAPISAQFASPDPKYFNENSVDPTQLIRIGNSANPTPFQ